MRDVGAAHVRAETDGHAGSKVCFCQRDDAVKDDLAVFLLLIGRVRDAAVEERIGKGGGDGRDLEGAARFEEVEHLLRRLRAVLDGIHAVLQRDDHTLGAFNVRRDEHAERMRLVARGPDERGGHAQHARLAHDLGVQHAAGDHQLDEVGLVPGDLLNEGSGFRRRMRLIGERARHVSAGDGDCHIRGQHARGENFTRRREIADARVVIRHAADGADRRHAGEQLGFGVALAQIDADLVHQAAGGDEFHEFFRVACFFLRLARSREVHVHIDETRQHIPAAEVDGFIACGDVLRVGNFGDLLAVDADGFARLRLHVLRAV